MNGEHGIPRNGKYEINVEGTISRDNVQRRTLKRRPVWKVMTKSIQPLRSELEMKNQTKKSLNKGLGKEGFFSLSSIEFTLYALCLR